MIVRDEGRYLREFMAYHLLIGFDHFFIYDNDSADNTPAVLATIPADRYTVIPWPASLNHPVMQDAAYDHCVANEAGTYDWLMFMDADEFLVLRKHRTIGELLTELDFADEIGFNWRIFGDGGHRRYQEGLVIERFLYASREDFHVNRHMKSMARPSKISRARAHAHSLVPGSIMVSPSGRQLPPGEPTTSEHDTDHSVAQVNHYFGKSWEEWRIKRDRGMVDAPGGQGSRMRPDSDFHGHNRNDMVDGRIVRRLPELRALLATLD
jgi:hypothetical protein